MSKVSEFCGLGSNPGFDPDGEGKHRRNLFKRLSFTPRAFLDNQRDMHFGNGLPEGIVRFRP